MSQDTIVIPNSSTATFRANTNLALIALISHNSGAASPAITYAYMLWADTTNNLLKMRNGANSAWIVMGPLNGSWLSEGAAIASSGTLTLGTDGAIAHVTGTTTITAISGNQSLAILTFDGALTLTHNASILLRDSASVTTRAGAVFGLFNEGAGVWREVFRTLPGEFPSLGLGVSLEQGLIFL